MNLRKAKEGLQQNSHLIGAAQAARERDKKDREDKMIKKVNFQKYVILILIRN